VGDERQLGAVVVGTGFGVLTHLRALRAAGIEVLALVGRDPTKTADRAERFGVPSSTTLLAEALALPGVDVVAVATPPHTHAGIVLEAVAAGMHVVCEKPFARDLDEARTMVRAAEKAGVVHLLGTEWRFGAGQAQLSRTVRSGAIGEPRHGLFQLQLPTHADPSAELPEWWQLESEGGGWLGAYGSHVIDQVRTTMGEVVGVSATLQTLADRPGMTADDTYTAHLRLEGGAAVVLHSSCASRGQFVANTKVLGSSGAAWLQGEEVWVDTGSGPEQLPFPDDLPLEPPDPPPAELLHTAYDLWHSMGIDLAPYARVFGVLRDRVLGRPVADDPVAATFVDGAVVQAVLDAIRRSSAKGGAWIDVESV
jgi:predicted dehydrogenase